MITALPSSDLRASKYAVILSPFLPKPGQSVTHVTLPIQRPSLTEQYFWKSARVWDLLSLSPARAVEGWLVEEMASSQARQQVVNAAVGMRCFKGDVLRGESVVMKKRNVVLQCGRV